MIRVVSCCVRVVDYRAKLKKCIYSARSASLTTSDYFKTNEMFRDFRSSDTGLTFSSAVLSTSL